MSKVITNVLSKFAICFDLKDWEGLQALLMDSVACNYQDLRGKSGSYTKEAYVDLRKQALAPLNTHHLFSAIEVTIESGQAYCSLTAMIYRKDDSGAYFNSHVVYQFELTQLATDDWRIHKIKQTVLWNEGDPMIHSGI
ncbi:MAG: hypothetical protein COB66_01930 [Coxiella sp. (in: Bacteria)]|nr:MAG: hypothetical protein COB66_01930 [Coxiella sp. (in: g-proteobacteria)]